MPPAPTLLWQLSGVLALASLALAGACAPAPADPPAEPLPDVSSGDLPPVPICRDELRAYLELTQLAKLHGEGWTVFEPAVDALKQQIIDCVGESRAQYRAL